ncbi:MAG: hypothetical protein IJA45_06660 [Oscillospiraceae bacterium]|nr:hypothetical protein [Oscillospiraceae bacterium]
MSTAYAGYTGKIMLVDLTEETFREYPWSDAERKEYLGGKPMAYKLLSDHLTGKEQAFSEENWIIISTGPLTLSGAPGSSRYDITTVSPLTKTPVSANCGGEFGLWLKRAGYDALILAGRCKAHRWLEIRDGQFVFHDAAGLWGTYTDDCRERLDRLMGSQKHGRVYIGPAGENGVLFASVMDGTHTSGRTGIGAVFGWKNLKAITVTGTKDLPIHNEKKAALLNKKCFQKLHNHPFTGKNSRSGMPTAKPCAGCPVLCRRQFTKGTDRQTELFNRLGMDAGSALEAADWAYAAAAQGVFASKLPAREQLYEDIAFRRGPGAELAEGVKHLSRKYSFSLPKGKGSGHDSHNRDGEFLALLRGWGFQPEAMSDESRLHSMLLYLDLCEAVSATGLCLFTVNAFCPEILLRKPDSLRGKLIRGAVTGRFLRRIVRKPEMLGIPLPLFWQTKLLRAVSGLKLTPGQLLRIGGRCFALEQLLSLRFGGDGQKLPKLLAGEKICTPGEYFAARGWSDQGVPPEL